MIDIFAIGKEYYNGEDDVDGPTYHLFKLKRTYSSNLWWEPYLDVHPSQLCYSPCLEDLQRDHPNAILLDFSKGKFSAAGYPFKEEHLL